MWIYEADAAAQTNSSIYRVMPLVKPITLVETETSFFQELASNEWKLAA